jgi:hypothetical protein
VTERSFADAAASSVLGADAEDNCGFTVYRVSESDQTARSLVAEIAQVGASKLTQESPRSMLTGSPRNACLGLTNGALRLRWKSVSVPNGLPQIDLPYSYSATVGLRFRAKPVCWGLHRRRECDTVAARQRTRALAASEIVGVGHPLRVSSDRSHLNRTNRSTATRHCDAVSAAVRPAGSRPTCSTTPGAGCRA